LKPDVQVHALDSQPFDCLQYLISRYVMCYCYIPIPVCTWKWSW